MARRRKFYGRPTPVDYCRASGKVCFDKRQAQTAANDRWHQDHVRLRIYPCPDCNAWHLTKTRTWEQRD